MQSCQGSGAGVEGNCLILLSAWGTWSLHPLFSISGTLFFVPGLPGRICTLCSLWLSPLM